ncbi:ABC transporter permease [Algoriphagus namhaensis]
MLKNYIKIAWRSLVRQKVFSLINILGLSIGLACFLFLAGYVKHERSFDTFHPETERLFRVSQHVNESNDWAWTGGAVAPMLRKEFESEIQEVASLIGINTYLKSPEGISPDEAFREDHFFYAEPGFIEIFDFKVTQGSLAGVLENTLQLAITESKAKQYFGEESPIGKVLVATGDISFEVKAVIEDLPDNTHMQFDFLSGVATFKTLNGFPLTADFNSFWWPQTFTYVKVKEGADKEKIDARITEVMPSYRNPDEAKNYQPYLQPVDQIHLRTGFNGEWTQGVDGQSLWIFLSIGAFVLILACINFINLATARAIKRSKEIGIRKVNGALKGQLIGQFLSESFLTNGIALLFGVLLVTLLAPLFNQFLGLTLAFDLFGDSELPLIIIGVWVASSLLAGVFPAFYLSAQKPDMILKQGTLPGGKAWLRKSLVVFQFSLSTLLVFCGGVAYFQHSYLQDAEMGFDHEGLMTVKLGNVAKANMDVLRDELAKNAGVASINAISTPPGLGSGWGPSVDYENMPEGTKSAIRVKFVDEDFFANMGIPVLEGREFQEEFADGGVASTFREQFTRLRDLGVVVNESAAALIKQENGEVLGKEVWVYTEENGNLFSDYKGSVVGVVKDYHTETLAENIKPTVFLPAVNSGFDGSNFLLIRLNPGFGEDQIAQLKASWKGVVPEIPFDYFFLDQSIEQQYEKEARTGTILASFAILTLIISCLGLFGLSIFTAESKRKEIGIRKVLGASVRGIIHKLSTEFLVPVILSLVISLPLGYLFMQEWLGQFAYKISITLGFFIGTAIVSVAVAYFTVSFQSVKAATSNPVDSIKNE